MSMSSKLAQHPLMFAAMLLAAGTGSLGLAFLSEELHNHARPASSTGGLEQVKYVEVRSALLEKRLAAMQAAITEVGKSGPRSTEIAALRRDLAIVRAEVEQSRMRQAAIEKIILTDPAKALELPILRRDLDDAQAAQAKDVVYLTQAIDRACNVMMGGLIALVVAILLMALDRFIGLGRPKDSE